MAYSTKVMEPYPLAAVHVGNDIMQVADQLSSKKSNNQIHSEVLNLVIYSSVLHLCKIQVTYLLNCQIIKLNIIIFFKNTFYRFDYN